MQVSLVEIFVVQGRLTTGRRLQSLEGNGTQDDRRRNGRQDVGGIVGADGASLGEPNVECHCQVSAEDCGVRGQ